MTSAKYDVLGIGNAIFDVLVQTDESFLSSHGMTKGGMALIDEARAASIYRDMGPATEMSGGSAANTIVGVASFGARSAYVGKVKDDQIGRLYMHDIRAAGVAFDTMPASDGPATGCSYILVTGDGERTMNTYLGAAQELTPADIDASQIAASRIVYLEGYLFDRPEAKAAFREAARTAKAAGAKVALSLSDAFCVDRHRNDFRALVRHGADIVFADALMSVEDIATVAKHAAKPLSVNMGFGLMERGTTPLLTPRQLQELGVSVVSYARMLTSAAVRGMMNALEAFAETVDLPKPRYRPELLVTFEEINKLVGVSHLNDLETRFGQADPNAKAKG